MEDCIFCKIVNREIKSDFIFENEKVVVFRDINPKAKTHLLIVSKKHITTINDLSADDSVLVGEMIFIAKEIAKQIGFSEKGYKLCFNVGKGGGQEVFHIHLHVMSNAEVILR